MKILEIYPSKYLSSSDLRGDTTLTIKEVTIEEVSKDGTLKPVITFKDHSKQLPLNKVNAESIAQLYGDETDNWEGRKVTLYTTLVKFNEHDVKGLRVKPIKPANNNVSS